MATCLVCRSDCVKSLPEEVAEAFRNHKSAAPSLPSSPVPLFTVHTRRDRPAPRFDAMVGAGMGIADWTH